MYLDKKSLEKEMNLRKKPYSKMTKSDIKFLKEQGIVNGVGPESYGVYKRKLMTWLFKFLNYEIHDINFWQQRGFHKSNRGLLKYSFISIADNYRIICKSKWYIKIYKIPIFFITLPVKAWIIALSYNAVESKKGLKAYNSCGKI